MEELHYGHFNELVQTGFAYLNGKIPLGLFEETVNRVLSALREGEGKFKSIQLPAELKSRLKEDLAEAEEGFKLFEKGIAKVREFVDAKDKNILWQGLTLVELGCDLLNEVAQKVENRKGEEPA